MSAMLVMDQALGRVVLTIVDIRSWDWNLEESAIWTDVADSAGSVHNLLVGL